MESLLFYLPFLACPLMMGLMMWMMMRGQSSNRTVDPRSPAEISAPRPVVSAHETAMQNSEPAAPTARPIWSALAMCLNGKVVAALAMVGLAVWVVAPGFIWAALPILVLAACPLSMLAMMRAMQGAPSTTVSPQRSPETAAPLAREDRAAELRGQLASVQLNQDAIARELAALEGGQPAEERQPEAAVHGGAPAGHAEYGRGAS
jgi:hypothetical protein